MDRHDIGHRFANQDFGKDGHLTSGKIHVSGHNYYSYNTIFGQWVDLKKKVCLVYQGSTSVSSSKHQLGKYFFPDDVHVFPFDDQHFGSSYGYHGCRLIYWDDRFEWSDRRKLLNYWIDRMYMRFHSIVNGKIKGLEHVSFEDWGYVTELCSLYKDTSVNKWLKEIVFFPEDYKKEVKVMVKLLHKGERNVQVIVDAMFGQGTYQNYMNYCERYRRADKKKAQMEWLCNRLGIDNPYEGHSRHHRDEGDRLTAKEIRKLTAKERIELHFNSIAWQEWYDNKPVRKKKFMQNKRNAYVWIVGVEPVIDSEWSGTYKKPEKVINKYTGEEYDVDGYANLEYHFASWSDHYVEFDYDRFRKAEDKESWIQDFYAKCKVVSDNIVAQKILQRVKANHRQGEFSWHKRYIDDEHLVSSTTPEEYALCKAFIERQEAYYTDLEARKRAEAIRRQREEEERKREKELQEQLKAEQIAQCLSNGIEGGRNLWRFHYMSISEAKSKSNIPDFQFYDGGNVLMRFGMKKDLVETSMSIKLDIPTCKKFWRLINIWHNDPSKFRETKIDTHYSGTYTIVSYKDDILTAGCHKIAYAEMERMYNSIIENEKIAV